MKRLLLATALVAPFAAVPALAQGAVCHVADPSGTPLNVRTAPNMRVVTTLPNGAPVRILETVSGPDGKRWSFVEDADGARSLGWVFRSYLDCR